MPSHVIITKHNSSALDHYEERIKELHSVLTLAQLKETIDGEAKQKIPFRVSQYRRKIEQLGLRKNRKAGETDILASILARMPKGSRLFLRGERLSQDEVNRIMTRGRPNTSTRLRSNQLPEGYIIRSPTPDHIDDCVANLPFFEFEKVLYRLLQSPGYEHLSKSAGVAPQLLYDQGNNLAYHPETIVEAWDSVPPRFDSIRLFGEGFANSPHAITRLEAVLPFPVIRGHVPSHIPSRHDVNLANISRRRQFLFSIANNFAGIDGFPAWQQSSILKDMSYEIIYQLFHLTKGPTARSIAQSLFKASIESNSHETAHALLSIEATCIDINREKIFVDGDAYTPVERASYLRHCETIKTLVHHGADVNMTYHAPIPDHSEYDAYHEYYTRSNGALECYVIRNVTNINTDRNTNRRSSLDIETFKILSNTTRVITLHVVSSLIRAREQDCLLSIMQEQFDKCVLWPSDESWMRTHNILYALSEENALKAIPALIKTRGRPNLLDDAVYRGYVILAGILISNFGFYPDGPTFFAALSGCDGPTIRKLLPFASPSIHMGMDYHFFTPLSCAIRTGDKKVIDIVRDSGAFQYLHSQAAFNVAWKAAVSEGNTELLDELSQLRRDLSNPYLNDLLKLALGSDNYQSAEELIVRGARIELHNDHYNDDWPDKPAHHVDTELYEFDQRVSSLNLDERFMRSQRGGSPKITKRLQSPELIELLLDYSIHIDPYLTDIFRIATSKTDYSLVRRVFVEFGAPTHYALMTAIEQRDEKLIDVLLEAGVNVNRENGYGALELTASMGDDHLTKYLLCKGADPNDPKALGIAFETNRAVFETILTAYKRTYGFIINGFGSPQLLLAVKNKDSPLIEKLLEHNADPHGMGHDDRQVSARQVTPFGYAIVTDNSSNFTMVTQFLNHYCCASSVVSWTVRDDTNLLGVRYPRKSFRGPGPKTTAFLAAIATEKIELVQLLAQGNWGIVHVPARGFFKRTALQQAAEIGSMKMVKFIHNLGADVNEPPNKNGGATALQLAAIGGFGQIVCYLIEHGADVNAPGARIDGITALVGAAAKGRIDIVAVLLNKGAGRGEDGAEQFERAMKEAEHFGHYPTVDYLKQRWEALRNDAPQGRDPMDEFVVDISDGD
ncbi:ankyrin [Nemania abortiva]|nr:ankyrin [Nemania abortiva]